MKPTVPNREELTEREVEVMEDFVGGSDDLIGAIFSIYFDEDREIYEVTYELPAYENQINRGEFKTHVEDCYWVVYDRDELESLSEVEYRTSFDDYIGEFSFKIAK